MINSCVGGVIDEVMAHHALPGNRAEVPRQADIDMATGESYLRMLERARPSATLGAVDAVGGDRVSP